MPDITMCYNPTCPLAADCYRHDASGTRPSQLLQSYASFPWANVYGKPACEYHWPIKPAKQGKAPICRNCGEGVARHQPNDALRCPISPFGRRVTVWKD